MSEFAVFDISRRSRDLGCSRASSSSSSPLVEGFCLNFAITPRQDRPVDTVFGPDTVVEHLTFSEQRLLLSLCLLSRPSLGLAKTPTQPLETRGVPLGHRNERAARRRAPRGRRIASPRTTGAVFRWRDGHASSAIRRIGLPTSHVGSAARRSTRGQPALAKRKTRTPSPTRRKSCRLASKLSRVLNNSPRASLEDFVSRPDQDV